MFGLLDKVHIFRRDIFGIEEPKCKEEYLPARNGMPTVAAFFPSALMQGSRYGDHIMEGAGKKGFGLLARAISSGAFGTDPKKMRVYLDGVYQGMRDDILAYGLHKDSLISCGVSMGCSPAARLAVESGISKCLFIAPGDKLAESFMESDAMAKISVKAWKEGRTLKEFVRELTVYDPVRYVSQFSGTAHLHIAPHDIFIPAYRGKELANAMLAESGKGDGLKVGAYYHWGYDHISLVLDFTRRFGEYVERMMG